MENQIDKNRKMKWKLGWIAVRASIPVCEFGKAHTFGHACMNTSGQDTSVVVAEPADNLGYCIPLSDTRTLT